MRQVQVGLVERVALGRVIDLIVIDKDHRWADGARDLLQLRARRLILVRHPKLEEPSLRRLQEEAARAWRNVVRYPPLKVNTRRLFTARGSCV